MKHFGGSLNANQLKAIAILAMTADHLADLLFPGGTAPWASYAGPSGAGSSLW